MNKILFHAQGTCNPTVETTFLLYFEVHFECHDNPGEICTLYYSHFRNEETDLRSCDSSNIKA